MARTTSPISPTMLAALLILLLLSSAAAKSPHPITDAEIRAKKNACYADIESGLWGWQCRSSMVAKENCALRCLSPACYELIYESDPLEEGEIDYIRSQEYKYCMHKLQWSSQIRSNAEHDDSNEHNSLRVPRGTTVRTTYSD